MRLSRPVLLERPDAVEKYKHRNVKIYDEGRGIWLTKGDYTLKKTEACNFTLEEALQRTDGLPKESNIQFYFEDSLGERNFDIKEYDDESIYNCPDINLGYRMVKNR